MRTQSYDNSATLLHHHEEVRRTLKEWGSIGLAFGLSAAAWQGTFRLDALIRIACAIGSLTGGLAGLWLAYVRYDRWQYQKNRWQHPVPRKTETVEVLSDVSKK